MAEGTKAGTKPQASEFEFPPATTMVTPLSTAASTASATTPKRPQRPKGHWPPKLMLPTAGRLEEAAAKSMPPIMVSKPPAPLSPSTFTPYTKALVATPNLVPAAVPAQCVPCPWLSAAQLRSPLHSTSLPEDRSAPGEARLPKSLCVVRTPVSS